MEARVIFPPLPRLASAFTATRHIIVYLHLGARDHEIAALSPRQGRAKRAYNHLRSTA